MESYKNLYIEDLENEIWDDCGFGYFISNLGRVKSKKKGKWGNNPEVIKKQRLDIGGYLVITLNINRLRKHTKVHRLMAKAFIPNPDNKRTVNHINGIRNDNRLENLEWATHSEQNIHSFRVLKRKHHCTGKFGSNSHLAKPIFCITNNKRYGSIEDAANELKVFGSNINKVCKGIYNHTGGYVFRFI